MPITGGYLARRFRRGVATKLAEYISVIQEEMLPVFSDLNEKSDRIADEEFYRLCSLQEPDNFDDDQSSIAEAAREKSATYYNTMDVFRRASLTLYTVGLFHYLEQLLTDICRDNSFGAKAPTETKLSNVVTWYEKNFGFDLKSFELWSDIDELRLFANTAKHGDGSSAKKLRTLRPSLFEDASIRDLLPDHPDIYTSFHLHLPIAGQDLFVTTEIFSEYGAKAFEFIIEIAKYFEGKADELYFND